MLTHSYRVTVDIAETQPGTSLRVVEADFNTLRASEKFFRALVLHTRVGTITLAAVSKQYDILTDAESFQEDVIQTLHCSQLAVRSTLDLFAGALYD